MDYSGPAMKKLCEDSGIRQVELANHSGVSKYLINRFFSGKQEISKTTYNKLIIAIANIRGFNQ